MVRDEIIMTRDQLVAMILAMPETADVVVGITELMSAQIADVRYDADRESIVIVPHPDDVRDAFRKYGNVEI